MSIKEQLAHAKSYIQAKEYDKARRILQGMNHPTATKWLQRLDTLAPPAKPSGLTANHIKIGLVAVGLMIVGLFVISMILEDRAIASDIEESRQAVEEAREFCSGLDDFVGCFERQMARFTCRDFSGAQRDSCIAHELESSQPPLVTRFGE